MRITNKTTLLCLVALTSVNAAWFKAASTPGQSPLLFPHLIPSQPPSLDPVKQLLSHSRVARTKRLTTYDHGTDAAPAPAPAPVDQFHHGGSSSPPSSHDPSKPIPTSLPPFTGLEYSLGPFKRIRPSELQWEIFGLLTLLLYLISSFLGRRSNHSLAKSFFSSTSKAFISEFAAFGMPGTKGEEHFKRDGGDEFIAYVTGRRGVESGLIRVRTGAWHDPLVGVYNTLRPLLDIGWRAKVDTVTIDLKLRPPIGTPNSKFVFAICTRKILREIRSDRWDLKTFTQTTESNLLPSDELIAMTESGDLSNALLKGSESGLVDCLKSDFESGGRGGGVFESLVISDMPWREPDELKPTLPTEEYQLTLTLKLPKKSNKEEAEMTIKWIHTICNLADLLYSKPKLVPEIALIKRKNRRAEVLSSLSKASLAEAREIELEKKENALALKKKLEKDVLEEKLKRMTKEERIKFTMKEKERERKKMIKMMGKKK